MPKTSARNMLGWALLCAHLAAAGPARAADPASEALFVSNCSACHQRNGKGIPQAFPALAGNPFVQSEPGNIVSVLLNGRGGMPSFKGQLDDGQIAAVASYVRGAWGNTADPVPAQLVAAARTGAEKAPPDRLQAH